MWGTPNSSRYTTVLPASGSTVAAEIGFEMTSAPATIDAAMRRWRGVFIMSTRAVEASAGCLVHSRLTVNEAICSAERRASRFLFKQIPADSTEKGAEHGRA